MRFPNRHGNFTLALRCAARGCRYYERLAGIDVTKVAEAEKDKRVEELRRMIGSPCQACAKAPATILCKACDCVMCVLCSDDVHDEDGPLASHVTERVDVRASVAPIRAATRR